MWSLFCFIDIHHEHSIQTNMENIPSDPMMLLSFLNMKLRDFYSNLDELCNALDVDKEEIVKKMAEAGFEYNENQNKFW